jgi:hypothetical protein
MRASTEFAEGPYSHLGRKERRAATRLVQLPQERIQFKITSGGDPQAFTHSFPRHRGADDFRPTFHGIARGRPLLLAIRHERSAK